MSASKLEIVLASASPRRSELLELAGVKFRVSASDIPEEPLPSEDAASFALRLAEEKARATAAREESGRFFIGADTIVVLDGRIMGKPLDDKDAFKMLSELSGRSHQVITAYTVLDRQNGTCVSNSVTTEVCFRDLSECEIVVYVQSGCPLDKAGGYAIQGGAAHFIRGINGSYTNVVGLPTCELIETLQLMEAL